jgi:senataxin
MRGDKDRLYSVIRVVDKMEAMASYWALTKDRFAP